MVHIILLILKTAGIVFLSLLGIVLLLLAAILFLPVTYRVYAEKEEKIKVHAAGGQSSDFRFQVFYLSAK